MSESHADTGFGPYVLFKDYENTRTVGQPPPLVIGKSAKIHVAASHAVALARTNEPVLLLGETGVGKELFARAIHAMSPRAPHPFIEVNSAALSDDILESEVFGHEKGSYTTAFERKPSVFELAAGGTIFFDEIGDASPKLQKMLLRVVETGTFFRVGGKGLVKVDFRIVVATNKNLVRRLATGRFREDLFYRLSVSPITLPPLRERVDDILPLASYFLGVCTASLGRVECPVLSEEACAAFKLYPWPGNIRSMRNVILDAVVRADADTRILYPDDFRFPGIEGPTQKKRRISIPVLDPFIHGLAESVSSLEIESVKRALVIANGNRKSAAKLLHIGPRNLRYILTKYRDQVGELLARLKKPE